MSENDEDSARPGSSELRFGYTTGACATAAAKAAAIGCMSGHVPVQVTITLPRGQHVTFDIVQSSVGAASCTAAVQKDAGDDPDVTHGALIVVDVALANALPLEDGEGSGRVRFAAGAG
ncbi:MAG: cobalt-precorrin-5B (C(1))-methyltransferase, partial [Pseudomonadota bacterium]